jgi:ketosteroid isomerase-like protein
MNVVHRYCMAWQTGDLATLLACYDDEVVLHWPGRNPLAGSHRGLDAVLSALGEFQRLTDRELVDVDDILVGPDHSVVLVRERLGGREVRRVLVYQVRDDKLVDCRVLDEDQHYVDELLSGSGASGSPDG